MGKATRVTNAGGKEKTVFHPNPGQLKIAPGVQQSLPFGYGHVGHFQRDPLQFWMEGAIYDIITSRRANIKDTGDVLSVLLQARHPKTGKGLTDQQIRNELVGILMPGYEPGALVFAWACHLLASNPPTQDLARKEVAEVLGGRVPTPEDIPRLPYLTSCYPRDHPPVPLDLANGPSVCQR